MNAWPQVALGEIFDIARGGSPRPIQDYITDDADGVNWISIADASAGSKYITAAKKRIRKAGASRSRMVQPGDFLLTNSMSFGRPYITRIPGCIHDGWLVLKSKEKNVDEDYFFHLLGSRKIYSEFARLAAGSTVKNLNIDLVKGVHVQLPPLCEQRRIAAILDLADALQTKHRQLIANLDRLAEAIFHDMFGDSQRNPKGWPSQQLRDVLSMPLRNGLSPSTKGKTVAKVLTLSAITGAEFDAAACKESTFHLEPPSHQSVDARDFLICRGNGNLRLVGKGRFPVSSAPDVTFPDTMIAARSDRDRISASYLQYLWHSPVVRRQIEMAARTTNGTFKISQKTLEAVRFPLPPLSLQAAFDDRIRCIEKLKTVHRALLANSSKLSAALQQRAFHGEL